MLELSPKIQRLVFVALQTDHEGEANNALAHARRIFREEESEGDNIFDMLRRLSACDLTESQTKWVGILTEQYRRYGRLKGKQFSVLEDIWSQVVEPNG